MIKRAEVGGPAPPDPDDTSAAADVRRALARLPYALGEPPDAGPAVQRPAAAGARLLAAGRPPAGGPAAGPDR